MNQKPDRPSHGQNDLRNSGSTEIHAAESEGFGQGRYRREYDIRGKGPRNHRRSDARLMEDVSDRLSDDEHLDASEIEVKVLNGEVMLTGIVADRYSKRLAADLAKEVSGVKQVHNQLRADKSGGSRNAMQGTVETGSKPAQVVVKAR